MILHCNVVFNSRCWGGAVVSRESLGLPGDCNEPMFVAPYHNIMVIFPGALSACMVSTLFKGLHLLLNYGFPVMVLNCNNISDFIQLG